VGGVGGGRRNVRIGQKINKNQKTVGKSEKKKINEKNKIKIVARNKTLKKEPFGCTRVALRERNIGWLRY